MYRKLLSLLLLPCLLLPTHAIDIETSVVDVPNTDYTISVDVDVDIPVFSVSVPTTLPIQVTKEGEILVSTEASIVNNSDGNVNVAGVNVDLNDEWTLVPYTATLGSKDAALRINDCKSTSTGFNFSSFQVVKGESLPLEYEVLFIPPKQDITFSMCEVSFTLGWAADYSIVSDAVTGPHGDAIIHIGETLQLELEGADPNATYEWISSDPDVATIDQDGLVTPGDTPGEFTIKVKSDGAVAYYDMQVYGEEITFGYDYSSGPTTVQDLYIPKHILRDGEWQTYTKICDQVFYACTVTNLYVPNTIAYIGYPYADPGIQKIYYEGTEVMFDNIPTVATYFSNKSKWVFDSYLL